MKRRYLYTLTMCLFILALAAKSANADTMFDLNLSAGNWSLPSAGNFGTVNLSQNGSDVNVTVNLASGVEFPKTGAGYSLEFNLPSSVTTADIANLTSGFTSGAGTSSSKAFGTFDLYTTCTSACGNGGSSPFPGPLSFTVDGVSISDFTANSAGYYFASDVIDYNVSGKPTGLVGSDGPSTPEVPEPPTLLLLGTGLALLAGAMKFRKLGINARTI